MIVSTQGYINGTALASHTSAGFNTVNASTLVAFVSTDTPWDGQPVSITGVNDNAGNNWSVLAGPTTWSGSSFTLVSSIYYVNAPITSPVETVTVNLSNPAPLVFHVFAVSGADIGAPPISSPITDPGAGGTSANVVTAPIIVPADSLLLSWVKNETSATATVLDGFTLDAQQSTSFLWAESESPLSAGTYTGQFQYSSAIGWQTAIVGLKPLTGPEAASQAVTTRFNTPINITLAGISPQGFPLIYGVVGEPSAGTLSGAPPNVTYTPATGYVGHDAFTFKVNDGTTDSNTATVSITVQGPVGVEGTIGYINSTPLTTHTSAAFNTTGSSTLVAFVSSHPSWSGLPVSITGLSDSAGNSWSILTGPTVWAGSQFTLLSTIYYVNIPITSSAEIVTVNLSNPAPLVLHVFAVSGADITGAPIFSPFSDPPTGGNSASVTTAPIAVPTNSLLLSWVKNETNATATTLGGYTLDAQQSTSFLWAEYETTLSAGSYSGQFQYSSAIGWQAAVVGLKPPGSVVQPVLTETPGNPTNQTSASFSFTDTQAGASFLCQLDVSAFSACTSPASYSGLNQGSHTFSVMAQDASNNQSAVESFTWTINAPPPPAPTISLTPANPTNQTSASFSFTDTQAGASFLCQLDVSTFSACTSPASYSALNQGSHTFSVMAQDTAGNQSAAATFTWTINTTAPPVPTITSTPANPTNKTTASFSFTDTQAGVSFLCQLDVSTFSACISLASYSGLSQGSHTFSVKALDTAGNQSTVASFTWTINTTPPPAPTITAKPANPTNQTTASFSFTDTQAGVSFLCQLDGGTFSACASPAGYTGLVQGSHTFAVKSQDTAGNQSAGATFTWNINTTPPPAPTITAKPANPTNQISASFSFTDTQTGVSFLCQLDGSAFSACTSPTTYSGLTLAGHTFSVKAQDTAGNQSTVASFTWTIQAVIISFGQVAAATPQSSTSTVAVTFPAAQAAGDLNIVVVGWNDNTSSVLSVKDSAGNAYNLAIGPTIGTALQQSIYYAANIAGGSNTVTVTFNQPAAFPDVRILEYHGATTLDVKAGASGSSGPANSGSATTTSGYELIFGASMVATRTTAAGSGFTSRIITAQDGDIAEDKIVTAAGSYNATVSVGPAGPWVMQMVTFSMSSGPAPTVTSVSPGSGPASGGTSVTITGTNFVSGATVTIDGTPATNVTVSLGTQITAITPNATAGPATVTVTNPSGQSGSLANAFTYVPPPTVSGTSPNNGPTAGGTAVNISGTSFATGATVTFGAAAATNVVVVSATQITATTPAGNVGPVAVKVTNADGQSGTLSSAFLYGAPTVGSISPSGGSTAGGTSVTITGTNFATGATVSFGTAIATNVVVVSTTQITAMTPSANIGAVTVTVTNTGGLSGNMNNGFTYGPPSVSSVSPNSGTTAGGTGVTIIGTNFASGAAVTFGSTAATSVVVVSGTQITATTPAGTAGAVSVTVTNSGGQSGGLPNAFTYIVIPGVTSVSPNSGPATGGTLVTITGTNFVAGATVTFGSATATNLVLVSGTQITATTPPDTAGAVAVTVTNPDGQSGSLPNGFTYQSTVAISFGQVAAATPQSPTAAVSVAFPKAETAGDLNIVVVGWNDTTSVVQSVNDSAGNTYNLAIGPTVGTALQQSIYYAANIRGVSNTVTVTFNQAAAFLDVRILEYRGVTTLDAKAGASGNSTTANSGSASTTSANELIFGASTVATTTRSAGTGFTSRIITAPDGDIAEDKIVTAAGNNGATANLNAGAWVMQMVTFK